MTTAAVAAPITALMHAPSSASKASRSRPTGGVTQAAAAADAGAFLISPFVGRILDWHKAQTGRDFTAAEDPGVLSVTQIYNYFKQRQYATVVMGASFRNVDEIIELAGCDLLTVSPKLLNSLQNQEGTLATKLDATKIEKASQADLVPLSHEQFLWQHNEDAMATEKLGEGIRNFAKDQRILAKLVEDLVS